MAIAGESTVAYSIIANGESTITVTKTQRMPSDCIDPEEAVRLVKQGFMPTVKGSDMAQFHDLWRMSNETIA